MRVPFVDLQAQYQTIGAEIDSAVAAVVQRADFVLGQDVREFEQEFARYCEAAHAVGVDSGYSALELILRAYEIGPGDEVITAANTFIATALAITACGARPTLVDVDPVSLTLDPARLEAAITPATRAVIPVHLYGHPADMDPIVAIARRARIRVVEDACQAHGARYHGRRVGSLGDAAAFSFYPGKNLGAYGDGGAVVTNDADLAERVLLLRNLGQRSKYVHAIKGYNHRLDTIQAAVLRAKLRHLDGWNQARRASAGHYATALADLPLVRPTAAPWAEHVYHLYVVQVRNRDSLIDYLARHGIATGIHYPTPIHRQEAYADLGYRPGDFPVTEALAPRLLSLPMYGELSLKAISHVAQTLQATLAEPELAPGMLKA